MAKIEDQLEKALRAAEREAASCAFLAPVFRFLNESASWPREVLEARFEHEYGSMPPRCFRHAWLCDGIAYKLQLRAYEGAGRAIPARVRDRARGYVVDPHRTYPIMDGWDAGDPKPDTWTFPKEARVTCATNPYQRGDGHTVAEFVALTGAAGASFESVLAFATALLNGDLTAARNRAVQCFTEHVASGNMKLHFDFSNPSPAAPV